MATFISNMGIVVSSFLNSQIKIINSIIIIHSPITPNKSQKMSTANKTTTLKKPDPPQSLLLEDAKGLPVFWSGSESVAKLVWRLTPSDTHKLERMTVGEVLEKFAAQDYVRNCVVSVVVSTTERTTRPCRMSDIFSTLWSDAGRGQTVKLILDPSGSEVPSKFLWFIVFLACQ